MPVNYESYQIDPFKGFNQGLANIGQALQYRREMERQKMLDAENKRLRDLQVEQGTLGIERTKAENLGTIGAYSEEGKPPPTLGEVYTKKYKENILSEKRKEREETWDFIHKVANDLKGTAEQKNKVIQDMVTNNPDPSFKKIASTITIEGDTISFTSTVTPEDIAKRPEEFTLPDGTVIQPGTYDIKRVSTLDPKRPFKYTEAKRREEKVKGYAPQAQSLVHPKTGVRKWFDMNKEEDIKTAQKEGFIPYEKPEKPEKPEKLTMTDVKSAYSMDIGNIKNQMMVEMTPDEQMTVSNLPPEGVMALLMSGKVGKSLPPERKKYYIGKLQEAESYYGNLTNSVLGRKGAKMPPQTPNIEKPKTQEEKVQSTLKTEKPLKLSKEQTNQINEVIKKEKARGVKSIDILKYMKEEGIDTAPFIDLIAK